MSVVVITGSAGLVGSEAAVFFAKLGFLGMVQARFTFSHRPF